jgi:hypothetical protein
MDMANPADPAQRGTILELLPQEMGANGMFVAAWMRK